MAGKTYKTTGIVLRKTKLGEKDLIVTVLDETGSLLRAVAKGARRPGGTYASRLELFSIVDLMVAQGRNLGIITDAAFAEGVKRMSFGIEQTACASVLSELLATIAQEDLPNERLYAMSCAAFAQLPQLNPSQTLVLACSALLKALAYAGFRPSFTTCVMCADPLDLSNIPAGNRFPAGSAMGEIAITNTTMELSQPAVLFSVGDIAMGDIAITNTTMELSQPAVLFSVSEGGVVCPACQQPSDVMRVDASTLQWSDALMRSRFEDVITFEASPSVLFDILHLIRIWTRVHAGKNLKSLDFLLSSGMF